MKWMGLTASLALCLGLVLVVPSGAAAAGGPVPPVQGSAIGVPGSPYRYVALGAGANTIVKRLGVGAGPARSELRVSGHYGIPAVDYNGSTTGLSADGRTLVFAELLGNSAPRTTRLLVLDTPRLAVRARLALPGWSTVDAISPHGRWLYLIHYASSNTGQYEVRAYDLVARRLLAKPVVDPRDRGEAMTGIPITRVMSADGRWAYTLYARPSGVPFVHALDTGGRRAVCIDLPSLSGLAPGGAHVNLTPGGGLLQVDTDGGARALVNTRTFAVISPVRRSAPAPIRPAPHRNRARHAVGGAPWELIVLSLAVLAVLAATVTRLTKHGRRARGLRVSREATVIDVGRQHNPGAARQPADQSTANDEVPAA